MSVMGRPLTLKTDNGPGYASRSFKQFCAQLGIKHITGIPYNPQGQGIVERANQTLKNTIFKLKTQETLYPLCGNQTTLLAHALFALNFLTLDTEGRSAADRFWHPHTTSNLAQVLWRDPLTGRWNGPDSVLTWGKGSACIFDKREQSARWIPSRLTKPFSPDNHIPPGSTPEKNLPSCLTVHNTTPTVHGNGPLAAGTVALLSRLQPPLEHPASPFSPAQLFNRTDHAYRKNAEPLHHTSLLQPTDDSWLLGRTWGLRSYQPGDDPGGLFFIKKELPQETPPSIQGPNKALRPAKPRYPPHPPTPTSAPQLRPSPSSPVSFPSPPPPPLLSPIPKEKPIIPYPYLPLLQASFSALNHSFPNFTTNCWLCLVASPPYLEAYALTDNNLTCSKVDNPSACHWDNDDPSLTIPIIGGNGTCIGKNATLNPYCAVSFVTRNDCKFYIPPGNTRWLCAKAGLQACWASTAPEDVCILVTIIPRVTFRPDQDFLPLWERLQNPRWKREPVTLAVTVAALLGAAGAGTGIAALTSQHISHNHLRAAVDEDIARLESTINFLEKSHASLAEVALQNRRGLDLLFLREGGLCAALGEECCFYANHSGVIRDSLAQLRKELEQRRKDRETNGPWYAQFLPSSPWFSAILSTLLTPLIVFILALTFGPWIFKTITRLVTRSVESSIKAFPMVQYHRLEMVGHTSPSTEQYNQLHFSGR
ncbi:MLV-related proviral Env polyprotein-like [Monodelphis domestica]|uniref:MLV-related proviral Env polyprotein-like n=1 Tax=Monodelphis domestica TaxID=13616 RepID=UPI0024E1E65C|nr:MLV-related proviral Env polyprotein-like [Monodelphis domestica]